MDGHHILDINRMKHLNDNTSVAAGVFVVCHGALEEEK